MPFFTPGYIALLYVELIYRRLYNLVTDIFLCLQGVHLLNNLHGLLLSQAAALPCMRETLPGKTISA
jgi:hypothetical protein